MSDFVTWSGWIAGLVGLTATIFFGFENRKLNKKLRSFEWSDVVMGSRELGRKIGKEFQPDVIYATDARGGIIAGLMQDSMTSLNISVCGTTFWKDKFSTPPNLKQFEIIEDPKVAVGILKIKADQALKRVLIVDDLAVTGTNLQRIREVFVKKLGFAAEDVKTCTLLASETAIATNRAPDFYFRTCNSVDFMFPWGKAR